MGWRKRRRQMLRLPREHVAGGMPLLIKRRPELNGGFFDTTSQLIEIGNHCSDHVVVEYLLHECLEASLCLHEVRYGNQPEQYVFSMDHRTFKIICSEVAGTVLKLLKANGYKAEKE